jgi:hypothetical protein
MMEAFKWSKYIQVFIVLTIQELVVKNGGTYHACKYLKLSQRFALGTVMVYVCVIAFW